MFYFCITVFESILLLNGWIIICMHGYTFLLAIHNSLAIHHLKFLYSGTILMEVLGNSLRVGISGSQYLNVGRASVLCILLRILLSPRSWAQLRYYNMGLDLQELRLKFLVLMTNIFASALKILLTFGEVCFFSIWIYNFCCRLSVRSYYDYLILDQKLRRCTLLLLCSVWLL